MENWIKCSDRMPEVCDEVLVFVPYDDGTGGYYAIKRYWRQTSADNAKWSGNHVPSHWMSLPEPPKEQIRDVVCL